MAGLLTTPLDALHRALGAKMVPFAGYEMPVQYELGVMKEHLHTRARAGLFDVSHMGQLRISGTGVGAALERLMPVDVLGLGVGRQRYGMFTSPQGGVLDDLMFANRGDHVFMVVNAACKADDLAHLEREIGTEVSIEMLEDRALLALQGPEAETALASLNPAAAEMRFMDIVTMDLNGAACWVSRSGYTGEDGYEVSVPVAAAEGLARALLDHAAVAPIGLGARDSLRLEAGLCLYGHDMDADTTPVEAGLSWAIGKARRPGGDRAGGFAGADRILTDLAQGPKRKRVGLLPEGRAPMREGVELFETETSAEPLGRITSGGFGPTIDGPVAMGYLPPDHTNPGTQVFGELRGKRLPLTVAPLPFTPANFKR